VPVLDLGKIYVTFLYADVGLRSTVLLCVMCFCIVSEKRRGVVTKKRWWSVPGWFNGMYRFTSFTFSDYFLIQFSQETN